MLSIPPEIKTLYKQDNIPKTLSVYIPELSLTIPHDKIVSESLRIKESACPNEDIEYGRCASSEVSFIVADVAPRLEGLTMILSQSIGGFTVPLGTYTIDSEQRQDNFRYKGLTSYNQMRKTDIDVASWYNSLFPTGTETYTMAQFRASFLAYVGLTQDTSKLPLPNDSMTIKKTIEPAELPGREVIEAIEEINGVFGHINRAGQFTHIILKPMSGLYPSNTLYPSDTLYPTSEDDTTYTGEVDETITEDMRETIRYEEYTVAAIDKLVIRSDDADYGAIVGTGTNAYFITGNFLVFGKTASELQTIATNAAGYMFKRPYRPYESEQIGLPYVEVGDLILNENADAVKGYVFNRTLKGIQALRDTMSASGSKETKQTTSVNRQFKVLDYKTLKLKADVDGVSVEVADLAAEANTRFDQTSQAITLEANRASAAEGVLSGQISVMAGSIDLKVGKDGVITAINLSPESATIKANKINFNGYATFDVNGNLTTIDGSVLRTGTVVADDVRVGWVYTGGIDADQINGGTITGVVFITTDGSRTTTISNGAINSDFAEIDTLSVPIQLNVGGSIQLNAYNGSMLASHITCYDINGGVPITSNNANQSSVGYASVAGSVQNLYTNSIYAADTGYGNIDFLGFDNAAGVNYVQANYQPKTPSDIRLKHNILPMDNIPDELFYSLKPYQFKYKTDTYGKGIFFGIIVQQLENAFLSYGLNPYEYDLVEVKDVRKYTDDGFYVNNETHRINYNNFIAWLIKIIQKQNERIVHLENIIK
jgi:hypothetical protein